MSKFLYKFLYFLIIPLAFLFITLELILHINPNTFNKKAEFLKNNKKDIQVLFLGSSHTQDGINPIYMTLKSSNLGYGSQDYEIDLNLLNNYINELPNLKYIIEEVDFIDFYKERNPDYFRYPWYEKYYGIELGSYPKYKKWSLYLSNPDFFNNYFKNYLFVEENINDYGYNDIEVNGEFLKYGYNENTINQNKKILLPNLQILNETTKKLFKINMERLNSIKELAIKNDIIFIQMTYPMHQTYYNTIETYETYNVWRSYINGKKTGESELWDFERNSMFLTTDFANSSHLNNIGAKKLTKMVNDSIVKLLNENN